MPEIDGYKTQAAARALTLVEAGMTLGLGTGSTANAFITLLAARIARENLRLRCVATSEATRAFAEKAGIAITGFDDLTRLDLTIDGADEIGPDLTLIKGGGGALLREKIVAMASDRVCIIADNSKRVERLGRFPLPIELIPFGRAATLAMVAEAVADAGCHGEIRLRCDATGAPVISDSGHLIADCAFGTIENVDLLSDILDIVPGVVEHGLFIGVADEAIVAGPRGIVTLRP
jgi:ribose 5-phosphate isomerase A